jgi:hypothetical protein
LFKRKEKKMEIKIKLESGKEIILNEEEATDLRAQLDTLIVKEEKEPRLVPNYRLPWVYEPCKDYPTITYLSSST